MKKGAAKRRTEIGERKTKGKRREKRKDFATKPREIQERQKQ